MTQTIRIFMFVEGASFLIASLIHRGVFITGYAHQEAAIAETVIAVVLLVGLGSTWLAPAQALLIGLLVQAFALLGTLVGIFTIAVGIGPRTVPDVAYHLIILVVLALGMVFAARSLAGYSSAFL